MIRYILKSTVLWNKVCVNLKQIKKKEFKVEIAYIVEVGSINTPNSYLLPLFNSFNFNLSFLMLPDIIFNNISVPFL